MSETPKTKSGWRWLRRILITLAILATLIAIFYTEEDWRGKRDWENYKREWEAKGEKFDWQAFVPPTVPDSQNFFCAPIFTNMENGKIVMSPYHSDGSPDFPTLKDLPSNKFGYLGAEGRTRITDLKIWQASYRNPTNENLAKEFPSTPQPQTPAKDVLFALSKFDSAVGELRQASERPYANVPLNYEGGFNSVTTLLPVLAELKRCTQVLQLRTIAELADGQNEKALADVKLMLYLNNSLRSSPFLISHLVRIAIVAIDLQPIWEGLAQHEWSDEQLAALETELGKLDFLADYEFVICGERAFSIAEIDNWRRQRHLILYSFDSNIEDYQDHSFGKKVKDALKMGGYLVLPSGWFYLNEMAMARINQDWNLKMIDTNQMVIFPKIIQQANLSTDKQARPWNIFAYQALPSLAACARKMAAIQSSVDLARVACGLERYRLAHGEYPETLDALAPQFIAEVPHDIINGQPLHYRRTDDGQFILYSVGWNEKDDGGEPSTFANPTQGDWVWRYMAQ